MDESIDDIRSLRIQSPLKSPSADNQALNQREKFLKQQEEKKDVCMRSIY
jgi:hypothetical protein